MTKLIPLDAAIAAMSGEFIGIDQRDTGERLSTGWWETSYQCEFGAERLSAAIAAIQAIPTIDPAAIREAALEACTIIDDAVKEGHDNPIDLILHLLSAVEPARRALALIGEKK